MAGMRVPARASSWLPRAALHVQVGQSLGLLQGQPNIAVVSRILGERRIDELVKNVHSGCRQTAMRGMPWFVLFAVECLDSRSLPGGVTIGVLTFWQPQAIEENCVSEPSPGTAGLQTPPENRLDSWKEIASYLDRDVTMQRWEKREGMPVHRHLHDKASSFYAFPAELDAWQQNRKLRLEKSKKSATWWARVARLLWAVPSSWS